MTPPRVLFLSHTGAVSGAEMVLLDVVGACRNPAAFLFEDGILGAKLRDLGVQVFASRFGRGFSGIRRGGNLIKAVPLLGKMAALVVELALLARRYDVLYANSQKAFVLGSLAAGLARLPLIWHLHDIVAKAHFGAGQRQFQIGLANRFARCVIAPSKPVADAFVAEGGRASLPCIVPNGLAIEPCATPKEELRRRLGLPAGPLIGVFSRLAPWKGQHVVLLALAKLPGVHCIVAGSPLFGEDAYVESLHALASSLDIASRVTFLGQRSDVPELMRAADAVVHPSVDPEPFGRTLVEAMLAQTPVVATDAGAAAEILSSGAAGMLVPPGDADALAEAVRKALCPGAALEAQIEAAEARAREVYGVEAMRSAIAALIERVANGKSRAKQEDPLTLSLSPRGEGTPEWSSTLETGPQPAPSPRPHPLADADNLKWQARQGELARERVGVRGSSFAKPGSGRKTRDEEDGGGYVCGHPDGKRL